jgi:copper transport protein
MSPERRHRPASRRTLPRMALATVFVGLLIALPAVPALAHAILLRSEPGDGAVLAKAPREVRLWFTERVAPELSSAELLDAEGQSEGSLRIRNDPSQRGLVHIALPSLRTGLHTLAWNVLSEDDAHSRRGLLVFRIGPGAKPLGAEAATARNPVSPLEAALRWLDVAALVALIGAVAVAGWVLTPSVTDGSPRAHRAVLRTRLRIFSWGRMAVGVASTVGIWILARQVVGLASAKANGSVAAVTWRLLGQTRWGALWLGRQTLLVAVGALLFFCSRAERAEPRAGYPRGRHRALPAAATLVAGLALLHILAGHAGSDDSRTMLTVIAGTVHVLSAGLWVGGLLALLIAWPLWDGASFQSAPLMRAYLRRFGKLALLSVGLILATGLFYAAQEVASVDALLTTLYGRALLGKTGLFIATGAFGLANAILLRPQAARRLARLLRRPRGWRLLDPGRIRTFVLAETCLGVLVLAGAGLLGASPPARGPQFAPASASGPASLSRAVDDLLVTVSVRPNLPGPNVFEVLVASTRRPPTSEIGRVTLRLINTENGRTVTTPPLNLVEPGRYRLSGGYLNVSGSWRVEAAIGRSGMADGVASFDWSLAPLVAARPVLVSNASLGPLLTLASLVVLVALIGGLAAWWLLSLTRGRTSASRMAAAPIPVGPWGGDAEIHLVLPRPPQPAVLRPVKTPPER